MCIEDRIAEFVAAFNERPLEEEEIEYMGTYLRSGDLVTAVLDPEKKKRWSESLVPDIYQPLYDMKVGNAEYAGGIFSAAPFSVYDPNDPQYEWLGLPTPTETLYEFCSDNCGSQYWLNDSLQVFGRNLDNEIQLVGALEDFVRFAIDRALSGENWYESINDESVTSKFRLQACEGFD